MYSAAHFFSPLSFSLTFILSLSPTHSYIQSIVLSFLLAHLHTYTHSHTYPHTNTHIQTNFHKDLYTNCHARTPYTFSRNCTHTDRDHAWMGRMFSNGRRNGSGAMRVKAPRMQVHVRVRNFTCVYITYVHTYMYMYVYIHICIHVCWL